MPGTAAPDHEILRPTNAASVGPPPRRASFAHGLAAGRPKKRARAGRRAPLRPSHPGVSARASRCSLRGRLSICRPKGRGDEGFGARVGPFGRPASARGRETLRLWRNPGSPPWERSRILRNQPGRRGEVVNRGAKARWSTGAPRRRGQPGRQGEVVNRGVKARWSTGASRRRGQPGRQGNVAAISAGGGPASYQRAKRACRRTGLPRACRAGGWCCRYKPCR